MSSRPVFQYVPPHEQYLSRNVEVPSAKSVVRHPPHHHPRDWEQRQPVLQQPVEAQAPNLVLPAPTVTVTRPTSSSLTLSSPQSAGFLCSSVLEQCCYYTLQVVFVSGTLVGFALVISGAVLHVQRGELLVFVYIGVLVMAVSAGLLVTQCHVRRRVKKRQRTQRVNRTDAEDAASAVAGDPQGIPLVTFEPQISRTFANHPSTDAVSFDDVFRGNVSTIIPRPCPSDTSFRPSSRQNSRSLRYQYFHPNLPTLQSRREMDRIQNHIRRSEHRHVPRHSWEKYRVEIL